MGDKYLGLVETLGEVFPQAKCKERGSFLPECILWFLLKEIHAQEDLKKAAEKVENWDRRTLT